MCTAKPRMGSNSRGKPGSVSLSTSSPTQRALIRTLLGHTPEFGSLTDERFDESRFEDHLRSDPRLALPECWYWIRKLQARVYCGRLCFRNRGGTCGRNSFSGPHRHSLRWPNTISMARSRERGTMQAASADEQPRHLEALAGHHRQLQCGRRTAPRISLTVPLWSTPRSPGSKGGPLDAMRSYERAIQSAREHGFVHNEGLAHEVAASFYLARGFETIAHTYLRNARNCYDAGAPSAR